MRERNQNIDLESHKSILLNVPLDVEVALPQDNGH